MVLRVGGQLENGKVKMQVHATKMSQLKTINIRKISQYMIRIWNGMPSEARVMVWALKMFQTMETGRRGLSDMTITQWIWCLGTVDQ